MEVATPSLNVTSTSGAGEAPEWEFLQCFGERSPGEDIQEGAFDVPPKLRTSYLLCSHVADYGNLNRYLSCFNVSSPISGSYV